MASTMLNWMTNAMLRSGLGDEEMTVATGMRAFPYELSIDAWLDQSSNIQGTFAFMIDLVVPLGTSISLPLLAATVVMEKEHRLRALMVMMGLEMRYYWLWEWIINTILTGVSLGLVYIVGLGFGIKLFLRSPGTSLILILLWSQVGARRPPTPPLA